jgi:hypothetical protein
MTRALFTIGLLCLVLTGCPQTTPKPNGNPRGPDVAALERSLELPPPMGASRALQQLKHLSEKGDQRARWSRLRYLFDLYDFARLTGVAPARALLLRALGGTGRERRGAKTTRMVLDRLVAAFETMVKASPPSPVTRAGTAPRAGSAPVAGSAPGPRRALARRLLGLLRSDLAFLLDPGTLPRRLKLLKAERAGPAGAAARLRLYAPCAQAFRVAARAAPEARPFVLNHCLYMLYELDPAPHLRRVGAPPHPPWIDYQRGLQRLLDTVAGAGPRMTALAGLRMELDRRFFRQHGARLPVLLHDLARDLPTLTAGRPYRGASALVLRADELLIGGHSVVRPQKRHYRVALTEAYFAGNRHTQLTLFAASNLPMGQVAPVLERAAATGFYRVGFGGVVSAPSREGYWRIARRATPLRLREVVVSLAPISAAAATLKTLDPAKLGWDQTCARDGLGVLLDVRQATPYGPDGRLPPLLSPRTTAEALLLALSRLRDAFPTACAVRIAADPKLSYAEFLAAITALVAAPGAASGAAATWRWVGYGLPPGKPLVNATFANRVAVRLAAKVTLQRWPRRMRASQGDLKRRIRPCYLKALDVAPARWGRLEVHSAPGKTLVSQLSGTSPEELSLNGCIARAVDAWRKRYSVAGPLRFRVQLKP